MLKELIKKIAKKLGFAGMDRQYTGNYPRYSGAISAVTGGPPEDINEMPAAENPQIEGPIYDGSSLDKGARHKPSQKSAYLSANKG